MSNRQWSSICLLLGLFLLTGCGARERTAPAPVSQTPAATPVPVVMPTRSPYSAADTKSLDEIKAMLDAGSYYDAFCRMVDFEERCTDPAAVDACEALLTRLKALLKPIEPASGTEFMRTFEYQGGGELAVTAESGPVIVTATSIGAQPDYVSAYVRQGDTAVIHLPAGGYHLAYELGYLWFGEGRGFGAYSSSGALDDYLYFAFDMDEGVPKNTRYELTF